MKVRGKLPEPKPTPHHPDEVKPGVLALDPARIDAAVTAHLGAEYASDDVLRLTRRALALAEKYRPLIAPLAEQYTLPSDQAATRVEEGVYLLDADKIALDLPLLHALVGEVIDLADFTDEPIRQALRKWHVQLADQPEALARLVRLNLRREEKAIAEAAEEAGLDKQVYWFVVRQVGCAFFPAFAAKLAPLVKDERWLRGTCPICGNGPVMAALVGDGGKRHLVCDVCGFVWTFARMRCPFCDNQKAETLKVLAVSDQSPHRLDVCENCKRYVKTLDYRLADAAQAVLLPIEDAATLYLDIKAGEAGYESK